jgi:hypothetical protein
MREANGGIDAADVAQFENLISHFCKQAARVGLKRSDVLAAIKKVRGVSEGYPRHKRLHIRYLFQWPFPEDP